MGGSYLFRLDPPKMGGCSYWFPFKTKAKRGYQLQHTYRSICLCKGGSFEHERCKPWGSPTTQVTPSRKPLQLKHCLFGALFFCEDSFTEVTTPCTPVSGAPPFLEDSDKGLSPLGARHIVRFLGSSHVGPPATRISTWRTEF